MTNDHKLQLAVLEQLDCDPSINASHIGVAVRDGVVVLTGHVQSFGEKHAVETAAGLVHGVKGVVEEMTVDWPGSGTTDDEAIAGRVFSRLSTNRSVPIDRIHIVVEDGVVTLTGNVDWHYQLQAVEADMLALDCIRVLQNRIKIRPPVRVGAVRKRVRDALSRISPLDAAQVVVKTQGSTVRLSGSVNSWHEKAIAETVARSVPGVSAVENQILVP